MLYADGFKDFLIFLVASGVIVPLFHRARFGAVLGFLVVGALLGPYGLGRLAESHPWLWYFTFDDPKRAAPFAELGIMFLLFLLGLELSFQRLWELRRYALGLGFAQVALTAVAIGLAVRGFVAVPPAGLVLGLCLALSSTAVVMQFLIEQRRSVTTTGRIALAVLLFQDLMVVPILFIVGILAGGAERGLLQLVLPFVLALAAVPLLMGAGRYVVRPLLRSASRTGSRELILGLAMLIVVVAAASTEAAGLSAALGAFLAGLLLSETEYRHQIEVDIDPFKALLLGIFFITVGTSVDLRVVVDNALAIVIGLVALVVLKAAILFGVARLFGIARGTAIEIALLLAQAGEFAFVVIGIAQADRLISAPLANATIAIAALSMMLTPLLALLGRRAGERFAHRDHASAAPSAASADLADHVIVGGFGRVGQMVARLLQAESIPYICVDSDGGTVERVRANEPTVYYGDAKRADLLKKVGGSKARAFVVTLDDPRAAERMVAAARRINSSALIFARAANPAHAARLIRRGAMGVIPETVEASLQLSARLLEALDVPDDVVVRRLEQMRSAEIAKLGEVERATKPAPEHR